MMTNVQRYQRIRTLALSVGMLLGMFAATVGPQLAHAQAESQTATKPAKKAKSSKSAKSTKSKAADPLPEKLEPLPEATEAQKQAAERVLIGRYECEFGKYIVVEPNDANKGYFNLKLGKEEWVTQPVLSSTGAVRLQDVKGGVLLIQILTKSMLMDIQAGRRLVDNCVHEVQRAAEQELRKHPHESLLKPVVPSAPAASE